MKKNKELEQLIYEIEIDSYIRKVSAIPLYQERANRIREIEPKKAHFAKEIEMNIISKLETESNPLNVYRRYLPKDTINILTEIRKSNAKSSIGEILNDFLSIKEIGNELEGSIKNKLKVPIILAFLVTLMMSGLLGGFSEMIHDPTLGVGDDVKFIADNYLFITIPILTVIGLIAFLKPQWVFGVKKVLSKVKSLMVCTTVLSMSKNGAYPTEIIPFLKRTYKMNKVPTKDNKIKNLSELLYKYNHITQSEDGALATVQYVDFELTPILTRIVENRKREAIMLGEVISDLIGNLSTLLLVIPFSIAGYPIGVAMSKLVSSINI